MPTPISLQATVEQLSAIDPRPDELQTIINQGTVLIAMAKDIELGHVPADVNLTDFKASCDAYCLAVAEFLHNPNQSEQV